MIGAKEGDWFSRDIIGYEISLDQLQGWNEIKQRIKLPIAVKKHPSCGG